jgi:hypothetical protein
MWRCWWRAAPRLPQQRPLTVGDAQAVLELRLDAQLGEPAVDLGPAAVHQHGPDAHTGQQHQVCDDASLPGQEGGGGF